MLNASVAHTRVLTNPPIICFKNDKSLKDHLFCGVLRNFDEEAVPTMWVRGRTCSSEVWYRRGTDETFDILKEPLDFNSNLVIYLSECKQCQYHFPLAGSTKTKFRWRINNYKST